MVHQYKLNGFNIVLDTCSGAVHVVDEVAYDMIEMFPSYTKEDIVEKMLEKYDAPIEVITEDVNENINALKSIGAFYE